MTAGVKRSSGPSVRPKRQPQARHQASNRLCIAGPKAPHETLTCGRHFHIRLRSASTEAGDPTDACFLVFHRWCLFSAGILESARRSSLGQTRLATSLLGRHEAQWSRACNPADLVIQNTSSIVVLSSRQVYQGKPAARVCSSHRDQ